jgi:renal tumor antigen
MFIIVEFSALFSGIYSKQPYTEYISTRWYRAPECLLTDGYYGPEMDLWGAGCVMFEITSLYPLFPGSNEVDQISRIHKVLGTPSAEMLQKFRSKGASHISFDFPQQKGIGIPQLIPHASPECVDLIVRLLKYDATERITAREAMRHVYFRDVRETETRRTSATTEGAPAIAAAANAAQASVKAVGQAQNAQAVQGQGQGIEALVGHNPAKAQGQGQGALQSQTENKVQPSIKALPSILGPSATNTDPSAASTKSIQVSLSNTLFVTAKTSKAV